MKLGRPSRIHIRLGTSGTEITSVQVGDLTSLVRDYVYLRLGDLVSLMCCTGPSAPESRGPWTTRRAGAQVHVTLNPFAIDLSFAVEAREIPDVPYPTDDALRAAIAAGRAPSKASWPWPRCPERCWICAHAWAVNAPPAAAPRARGRSARRGGGHSR